MPVASPSAVLRALPLAAAAMAHLRSGQTTPGMGPPDDWREWLAELFPAYATAPFAERHEEFWDWVWSVEHGERPLPLVAIWPRGGAKSTSAELAAVAFGARRTRRYGLYVCGTQERADDHVGNVAAMLESRAVEKHYPDLATRSVGKYGASKGWRRNRLRTASGFTLDAIGLDVAARGAKLDEQRPDFLILDDVDEGLDTPDTTTKKLKSLTRALLPAGTADLAVLAVQNLIIKNGVFGRLCGQAEEPADFLVDRIVSGPHPAIDGAAYEQHPHHASGYRIVGGTATWAGQSIDACQQLMNTIGYSAFLVECQHETDEDKGGLFDDIVFRHCAPDDVPALLRIVVAVDPAVTSTDHSDSHGVQVDGIAADKPARADQTIYRLHSWEERATPTVALKHAIRAAVAHKASEVVVETDQGGDLWKTTYEAAWKDVQGEDGLPDSARPRFRDEKAGAGHGPKVHRAQLMLGDYEAGRVVHVLGTHAVLERALRRFPLRKPFDLTDAAYWSWHRLRKASSVFG